MSERLEKYRQRLAAEELRNDLSYPVLVFSLFAVLGVGSGLLYFGSLEGLLWLTGGLAFGAVALGMYRCYAWTRLPAAAILAAGFVFASYRLLTEGPTYNSISGAVLFGIFTVYLLLPSTGRLFSVSSGVQERGDAE